MRGLVCVIAFLGCQMLLVYGQQYPSCNGMSAKSTKCQGGIVPPGYFEGFACNANPTQPEEGLAYFEKWIAFNVDDFECQGPTDVDGFYMTICTDTTNVSECYHTGNCAMSTNWTSPTTREDTCVPVGTPSIVTATTKKTCTTEPSGPSNFKCLKTKKL
jgi:hypothetical protein